MTLVLPIQELEPRIYMSDSDYNVLTSNGTYCDSQVIPEKDISNWNTVILDRQEFLNTVFFRAMLDQSSLRLL